MAPPAALATFCTCLSRSCFLDLSSAWASCLIGLCKDVKASVVTGITGVTDVRTVSTCALAPTASAIYGTANCARGFVVPWSTRSGLNGTSPFAAHADVIFFLVKAHAFAGL
ncbi:hypothetical protein BU25DRAFT_482853 [Macroventuria anomochaeta]|uniref:Uncharacterized protein n=1 Tax=Macroventuria anomochaeta TaxID=301207 RepID=A0ACB6RJG0_9PLEO|nr:uncharacterized protein BU25DRAFT_482853 [Macroventuria anomochaeta]KAF2621477.1 hypothetical protein BU25DRAFT_482853 [Macroventuria anomochaeta]